MYENIKSGNVKDKEKHEADLVTLDGPFKLCQCKK